MSDFCFVELRLAHRDPHPERKKTAFVNVNLIGVMRREVESTAIYIAGESTEDSIDVVETPEEIISRAKG